jgi:putative ABC transport system ATP-binding protein
LQSNEGGPAIASLWRGKLATARQAKIDCSAQPKKRSMDFKLAQNPMQTLVKCENLTKTYGKGNEAVQALRGVNLEVYSGEIFMLVGPSGCGKTTLISIIAGILNPSEGTCEVLGKNIGKLSNSEKVTFRKDNIGFVFQSFNLLPALTAAENVAVPFFIKGEARKTAIKKANEMLEKVGLKGREKSLPSQLSGGQQQRVAIARALAHNPKIIVCDEPTSALDHETGTSVMTMMRDIVKTYGHTLIIVTHDNRIFEFADRIGYMDDGMIKKVE